MTNNNARIVNNARTLNL